MTTLISSQARIGVGCEVGAFSVVHDGVSLGDGSRIGNFCEIGSPSGEPLEIGSNSMIRSYTNIQGGSIFGESLQTGQYTMIRGGMKVGLDFRVGSNCELQGSMQVGDYVRIQSGVHLGKGTVIGDFVWLFPNVLTVNDPLPPSNVHEHQEFEALCMVAANSLLMPGVRIGFGGFVAAGSVVRNDVAVGSCVKGDPASPFTTIDRLLSVEHRIAHPWPRHFNSSLDEAGLERVNQLMEKLLEQVRADRSAQ